MDKILFSYALFFACLSLGLAADGPEKFLVALFETCDPQHKLKCAGVLIDKDTIVTAAHCVHGSTCLKAQIESAKFGTDASKQRDIKQVTTHPFYVYGSPDYDVAVIKLQSPFELELTPSLLLPESQPNSLEEVEIGGWALSGETPYKFELYKGMVMDKKMCQSLHNSIVITNRLICFNNPFLSSVGGYPVFMKKPDKDEYYLVGIATRKSQGQGTNFLFANIYSSEIRSFLSMYFPPPPTQKTIVN